MSNVHSDHSKKGLGIIIVPLPETCLNLRTQIAIKFALVGFIVVQEKNAGDGLRLTKLEVARVLRERNEYKEKYLSLLEQVRYIQSYTFYVLEDFFYNIKNFHVYSWSCVWYICLAKGQFSILLYVYRRMNDELLFKKSKKSSRWVD
jgi:hypothetical protein